jgi:O-antigen/teichoic acid export membrane protein
VLIHASVNSLLLRALTLASKFVLTIFMARYMTPADLGTYGLLSTVVYISLLFLSLDFYVFNTRELLQVGDAQRPRLIRDQFVLFAIVYVFALPLLLGVFAFGVLPWSLLGWFYLILVLEHVSQEGYRLLITLSRPVMANAALFLRQGAWIYLAVGLAFFVEDLRDLTVIWVGWVVGAGFGIALVGWALSHLPWHTVRGVPVDWRWIGRGVRNALVFLLATTSLLLTTYLDRFFLQSHFNPDVVGVYVFYNQMANVVQTFVNTGVTMILYPRVVAAFQAGDLPLYKDLMRRMAAGGIAAAVVLAVLAALAINPLLLWLDRPAFGDSMPVFWIMLATSVLSILSLGPYYALYARRRDRLILAAHLGALVVAIAGNALLTPRFSVYGAASATLAAYFTLCCLQASMVALVDARHGPQPPRAA